MKFTYLNPIRSKDDALRLAKDWTKDTRRKHVVRQNYDEYFVTPLYASGREGSLIDSGYESLGTIVKESL